LKTPKKTTSGGTGILIQQMSNRNRELLVKEPGELDFF
jgi:hypothetical protein